MWCVAELDPEYLRRMEDVLALYEKPLDRGEPVVWIDEKPVVLHADLRPCRPECVRDKFCGATASTNGAARPTHFAAWSPRRDGLSARDCGPFLARVRRLFAGDCGTIIPAADNIHLVMDNLSSAHPQGRGGAVRRKAGGWLWDRFRVHYTPKHGSWLNQAEIEISLFARQCLARRRIPSLGDLRRETRAWGRRMNRNRVTIELALYPQKGTLEVRLQKKPDYAVRDLVCP